MAETYTNVRTIGFKPILQKIAETEVVSFRPLNGGLSVFKSAQQIERTQSARMRDVGFVQDDIRKAPGTVQFGGTFPDEVMNISQYELPSGLSTLAMIITLRKLYSQPDEHTTVEVPGDTLVGTTFERWSTLVFDDAFYFVSPNNVIRRWPSTGAHTVVADGFAARGMFALNNHIILAGTYLSGVLEPKTIRWSQNYEGTVSFSGIGSGARDLADSEGNIQNCRSLNPLVGLVFKTDSIVEVRATGDVDNPFDTPERAKVGLMLPYTVADYQGSILFVANDEQIYLFNGSAFDAIGNDVKRDFFGSLQDVIVDRATATFNPQDREYVIALPTIGDVGCRRCYAFDIDRRRWRYFEYPGLSCFSPITYKVGTPPARRFFFLAGTLTKKVLHVIDESGAFDTTALQFSYETGDYIGNGDGSELTLQRVVVGYRVTADGPFDLIVSLSRDEGQTFEFSQGKVVKGVPEVPLGLTLYEHFDFNVTGLQWRVKLTNAQSGKIVHIHSIDIYVNRVPTWRPGAIR